MRADIATASFAGSAAGPAAGSVTHSPIKARISRRIWSSPINILGVALARPSHTLMDVRMFGIVEEIKRIKRPLRRRPGMGSQAVGEPGSIRLPFYYGWGNLVLGALAMTATFPGRTNGLAMINKPLQADLRIGDIFHGSLNFWSVLLGAALCWPVGRLLDRLGTRPVLTAVVAALGAVVLWMSRVDGPAELFVALTLSRGLGQGALSVASMAVVGKWFRRRLGPAMGAYSFLLAVGFVAVTLRVGAMVEAQGWRSAWAEVGWGLLLGVAPLSALLVRSTPEGSGLADPAEFASPATDEGTADGAPLSAALRSPAFWVLTLAASLFNMIFSAFTFFSESVLEAQG